MSEALRAIEKLRDLRQHLNDNRKFAAAHFENDEHAFWVYPALEGHVRDVDEILALLVPGSGAGEEHR